jgi:hypothetical protein
MTPDPFGHAARTLSRTADTTTVTSDVIQRFLANPSTPLYASYLLESVLHSPPPPPNPPVAAPLSSVAHSIVSSRCASVAGYS